MPAPETIDYYFAPMSGYAYLGHARFLTIAQEAGCKIRYHPLDMLKVFAAAGSFPPAKYPQVRQHHRKADMARWAKHLDLPINTTPAHWPVPMSLACAVITAAGLLGMDQGAVTGAVLAAVWDRDLNISDPAELALALAGFDAPALLSAAASPEAQNASDAITQHAIEIGIFGSPTYAAGEAWFFGQDRLSFLAQHLAA